MTEYSGGGGGAAAGITIGTSVITGGSDGDILYNNGGLLGGFQLYDDTGAGNGAFALRKTMSGSSATSNFFSVTGTMAATLTAAAYGINNQITGAGSSAQNVAALNSELLAGFTGASVLTAAVRGVNASGAIGNAPLSDQANYGGYFQTTAALASASYSIGVMGRTAGTNNASAIAVGVFGLSNTGVGAGANIGVRGHGTGASSQNVGGFFSTGSVLTSMAGASAALTADNGDVAGNIFLARDNGTAVFTIADGGLVTATNFVRISGGELALNADYTNATAVMSNLALSATLVSGRTYSFTACLFFSNSTAADGCLIDFNGGTATITNFRAHAHAANAAGAALAFTNAASVALDTDIDVTLALTTQALMMIQGTIVPSANGTFIMRASEKVDGGGTLTIFRGSWLDIRDANPL